MVSDCSTASGESRPDAPGPGPTTDAAGSAPDGPACRVIRYPPAAPTVMQVAATIATTGFVTSMELLLVLRLSKGRTSKNGENTQ